MSKKNRYDFTKKIYSDYIVLIKYRDKYITYGNDELICNYIGFYKNKIRNRFNLFKKYHINYLILDDLEIIEIKKYDLNNYDKYVYIVNLRRIIKKINNKLLLEKS